MGSIHVNTGSNKYPNSGKGKEKCWRCGKTPVVIAHTYFGAPLCPDCWDSWWLTTEDGETDPPFADIQNSFWIGIPDERQAPDAQDE